MQEGDKEKRVMEADLAELADYFPGVCLEVVPFKGEVRFKGKVSGGLPIFFGSVFQCGDKKVYIGPRGEPEVQEIFEKLGFSVSLRN